MAEAKEKKTVSLQSIFDGYAAKAAKTGKPTEVDIKGKFKVKFTEDFGVMKKGKVQNVSKVMFDFYTANGVIKLTEKE